MNVPSRSGTAAARLASVAGEVEARTALAQEFLAQLGADASPWAPRFESWAHERGLGPELARRIKVMVLRERVFRAMSRGRRRAS